MGTMKTWPTLYKKTSTGAIQCWEIMAEEGQDQTGVIYILHGQVGGKMVATSDVIREGKNAGKKNATTAMEQALAEAESKFQKSLKKGYVLTIAEAEAGTVDAVIEGGVVPMLAHKHSEHGAKVKYPAMCQPKLDGIRCIAVVKNGVCTLWSRTRKPIRSVPHIVTQIEDLDLGDVVLDGELYAAKFADNFDEIISLARKDEPGPGHEQLEYHVYDYVSGDDFFVRSGILGGMLDGAGPNIKYVYTATVNSAEEMSEMFARFMADGYEGLMLRATEGPYEHKRSYGLQKVKEFVDEDFPIFSVEEGRGKLMGHVGAFVCQMPDGRTFKAKPMGRQDLSKQYWENHDLWKGKKLVVKYQNKTPDGIPRFPVGVRLRDSEDF